MGFLGVMKQTNSNGHNKVKNPNWQEAASWLRLQAWPRIWPWEEQIQQVAWVGLKPGTTELSLMRWPLGHAASLKAITERHGRNFER